MKSNDKFIISFARIIEIALGICLASIILTIIGYLCWAFFHPKVEALTRPIIRNDVTIKITTKEKQLLDALTEKGAISTSQDIVSQIIAFYDTQNAFLLGIMALSGVFGFLFIRQRTRNETEALLKTEFETFTKTIDFQSLITALVNNSANVIELGKTADDLYEKIEKLNKLEEKSEDKIGSILSNTTQSETSEQGQGDK
ncbi:hypothetical protein EHQ23_19545 [Leptospira bourretii]|uniref:Uncharacterized protein n=1 Tax=Leptospira bourretii TaxID=2484962 RepID=A0A4R9IQV3_9LEPT|nr:MULTISPECIES: hypothetical protein [Leptospira]TGK79251.1 hypothetical protein EHQ23_19545 [Leptospira bourretii]TGK94364.1 hypothetical protein EHQ26_03250 [Leptospira bourretii]TGL16787.1 hypothetical protein EHQ42_10660 [Leptospira levettii]TGL38815.1 hypothetical protein EHQ45_04395 [Leptospira bourretii]